MCIQVFVYVTMWTVKHSRASPQTFDLSQSRFTVCSSQQIAPFSRKIKDNWLVMLMNLQFQSLSRQPKYYPVRVQKTDRHTCVIYQITNTSSLVH